MKRLARMLPLVMILLLIGAVVNIAIAWVLSSAEVPNPARSFYPPEKQQWWHKSRSHPPWPRQTPERWPEPTFGAIYQRRGATHEVWLVDPPRERRQCEITITSSGWPARAMAYEAWSEFEFPLRMARTDGHPRSPIRLGIPWRGGPKRLPLTPIPAGFAINTLFYATLAAALWLAAHRARSVLRSRRGRCPRCAYPRVGIAPDAPCPECGSGSQAPKSQVAPVESVGSST